MKIVDLNNVVFVLLVIFCVTSTVENRPNKNELLSIKPRHRRNKNNDASATRLSRKGKAEELIAFQRYLIRELFSKNDGDNGDGEFNNARLKKWLKTKLRRLEVRYLNRKFRGYRKSWRMRRQRRNGKAKSRRKKNDHGKGISLEELMSISQRQRFDYEHIATLQSQPLEGTDVHRKSTSGLDHRLVAFDVSTLPHKTSESDHAKLIVQLAQGNNDDDDDDGDDGDDDGTRERQTRNCNCDILIREFSSTRKMDTTSWDNAVTISKKSVEKNALNSFDVSNVIKGSKLFTKSNINNNKIDDNKNHNPSNKPPQLLYLSFQYSNCSFHDKQGQNKNNTIDNEDMSPGEALCNPGLRIESNDDEIPLLVLYSEKQANDANDAHFLKNDEENLPKPSFYRSSVSDTLHRPYSQNFLGPSSSAKTNQKTPESNLNSEDNGSGFHRSGDSVTADDSWMSRASKNRSKRRAYRVRGWRNSCRREEMYVDFSKMKWAKIVAYPTGYAAYQCVGRCYSPIQKHLTPTTHAMIQNQVHARHPRRVGRACCVPTKLKAMHIMLTDKDLAIRKEVMNNMVVTECGCR